MLLNTSPGILGEEAWRVSTVHERRADPNKILLQGYRVRRHGGFPLYMREEQILTKYFSRDTE